jgi:hypothetical protein
MAMKTVYEFYAKLHDFEPSIWRRIRVVNTMTVAEFAYVILTLFEMQASHLFKVKVPKGELLMNALQSKEGEHFDFKEFKRQNPEVHKICNTYELLDFIDHEFIPQKPNIMVHNVTKSKLSHAVSMVSETMQLWYDYGDDWLIDIKLEKIYKQSITEVSIFPEVIDGEGYGIIEDCGGVYGLSDLVKTLKNKNSKKYKDYQSWLNIDDFDIFKFDQNDMNNRLQVIPKIYKRSYERKTSPTMSEIDYIERRY